MNILLTITILAFFIWEIKNILFWVGLWQDKEYRRDRLVVHLRETMQGRGLFFSFGNIVKWLLFIAYIGVIFVDSATSPYENTIALFYCLQALYVGYLFFKHRIKRPVLTKKAILLCSLSFGLVVLFFLFPILNMFVWLLIIDRITFLLVSLWIFFFSFPTEIYRDIQIQKATKKIKKYKKLLVIAVSGSYGKTSTKEYIAQILSKKFIVAKTPSSNNTPIGIAQAILKNVTQRTEVFVIEMGAYKKGEIAQLTQIARPEISVTTSISDQHISLYGSMENIITSEKELLDALPKKGLALFNGNNPQIEKLVAKTKHKKIIYQSFSKDPKKKIDIGAYRVVPSPLGTTATIIYKKEEFVIHTNLLGVHIIENILPGIFLGRELGMTQKEVIDAVANLVPPAKTLNKVILKNHSIGIDDTFNVSPESVLSALDFIHLYKHKKICILSPLTELGKHAKERYSQIGEKLGETCDCVYVLNKNYLTQLQEGINRTKNTCELIMDKPEIIADLIRKSTGKNDVVLFEGKEAAMILKKLV